MVSISACHAEDPGAIPDGGVLFQVLASCLLDMDLLDRARNSATVSGTSNARAASGHSRCKALEVVSVHVTVCPSG